MSTVWSLPPSTPDGWEDDEIEPAQPSSRECFAALFHGDKDEYFCCACVLSRRLVEGPDGNVDRVLLCGPGRFTRDPAARRALRAAGWNRLLPVVPVHAAHLDRTRAKRHELVFTKLRVLELPYERVLLLDLDLLPRCGAAAASSFSSSSALRGGEPGLSALFAVRAPAAKHHGADVPQYACSLDSYESWRRDLRHRRRCTKTSRGCRSLDTVNWYLRSCVRAICGA